MHLIYEIFQMVAPMCLLFLNKEKTLLPLAIQLKPQPATDNRVSILHSSPKEVHIDFMQISR